MWFSSHDSGYVGKWDRYRDQTFAHLQTQTGNTHERQKVTWFIINLDVIFLALSVMTALRKHKAECPYESPAWSVIFDNESVVPAPHTPTLWISQRPVESLLLAPHLPHVLEVLSYPSWKTTNEHLTETQLCSEPECPFQLQLDN